MHSYPCEVFPCLSAIMHLGWKGRASLAVEARGPTGHLVIWFTDRIWGRYNHTLCFSFQVFGCTGCYVWAFSSFGTWASPVAVQEPTCIWDLSSQIRDRTHIPCIGRGILNHWTTREVALCIYFVLISSSRYSFWHTDCPISGHSNLTNWVFDMGPLVFNDVLSSGMRSSRINSNISCFKFELSHFSTKPCLF